MNYFKKSVFSILAATCLATHSGFADVKQNSNNVPRQLFGYYSNWDNYDRAFSPDKIPTAQLTAVLYAFEQVGNCARPYATDDNPTLCNRDSNRKQSGIQDYLLHSTDYWADYNTADQGGGLGLINKTINAAHTQGKKALLSIGGWTLSVPLTTAMDQDHQEKFIASIITFLDNVKTNNNGSGFDGVDIDWEPNQNAWDTGSDPYRVTPEQFANYASFLANLHQKLQAHFGAQTWLTIAAPANPEVVNDMVTKLGNANSLKNIAHSVNYINIMSYDYHGAFDSPAKANFLAALHKNPNEPTDVTGHDTFNVEATVNAYLQAGVPAQQLIVGFPLYSRAVKVVGTTTSTTAPGLYQTFDPNAAVPGEWEPGLWDYKKIQTDLLKQGYQEYSVPGVGGAAAFNAATGIFMSYDNADTLKQKVNFVKANRLGGMMAWELSGDLPADNSQGPSLVRLAADQLTQ